MAIGLSFVVIVDLIYDKDKKLAGKEFGKRSAQISLKKLSGLTNLF
jgi:hypothetical protein